MAVACNQRSSPGEIWNWPLYTERKERPKKEADHSRLVSGRFDKGTYIQGLSWASIRRVDFPIHPPRILKVYLESLTGFSHVYCPDGLNNTLLSQGCIFVLEMTPVMQMVGRTYIPRMGEVWGWGAFDCLGPALRSTCSHVLSTTSSNSGPLKLIKNVEEDLIWRIFTKVLGMGDTEESQGMLPWFKISHYRAVTTPKLKGTRKDGMARESHTENWPDSSSDLCLKRLHIEGPTDKHPEPTLLPPSHL